MEVVGDSGWVGSNRCNRRGRGSRRSSAGRQVQSAATRVRNHTSLRRKVPSATLRNTRRRRRLVLLPRAPGTDAEPRGAPAEAPSWHSGWLRMAGGGCSSNQVARGQRVGDMLAVLGMECGLSVSLMFPLPKTEAIVPASAQLANHRRVRSGPLAPRSRDLAAGSSHETDVPLQPRCSRGIDTPTHLR